MNFLHGGKERNATSNTSGFVLPYRNKQIALADGNHTDF